MGGARKRGSSDPPVLLFVVNVAWFFCMHRLHLAKAAMAAGFEVHVAAAPESLDDVRTLEEEGVRFHALRLHRGDWSVLEALRLTVALFALCRKIRPAIAQNVTIKPVLCGTLGERLAGVPGIINAMTGLGFVYTARDRWAGLRRAVVSLAYRMVFSSRAVHVVFENRDDLKLFTDERLVAAQRATLVRGAGVDLARFRRNPRPAGPPLVVLPARMLWDKGVSEFCEAAAVVRGSGINVRFVLVGGLDPGNPATIPESWLAEQQRAGTVEWWGHRADIAAVYAQADVVCLPSYREGLPTVLLEGAASGCALVTTDVPGCREVVEDGRTGLLVPARDAAALAKALTAIVSDGDLRERLASAAYENVRANFSTEIVQRKMLSLYRSLSPCVWTA
jgi:glycosyltransferase involved in cell wall biosynthesis